MLVETNFKIRAQNQPKHPKYVQPTMVLIFIKLLGPSVGKIVKNVTAVVVPWLEMKKRNASP